MKITIDRDVLEQAFDAIDPSLLTDEASAAIREALAQPQQEPVPPELFAQQIAAAMRYADAPLTHDQFVTLVLYLKARSDGGTDNAESNGGASHPTRTPS